MKTLYAPWRKKYAKNRTAATKKTDASCQECVFCAEIAQKHDAAHFILKRTPHAIIMLNLYPYNPGHLIIVPVAHQAHLNKLTATCRRTIMELLSACTTILQEKVSCDGFNIGINLGDTAGAGIPAHLHWHVVPRWQRDTNFMPIIGQTKVCSLDLEKLYKELKPAFAAL